MKKLLVCDVEGTIFKAKYKIDGTDYASTMWQPLAKVLGETAIEEEKNTHAKWENNEYKEYAEWVEDTIKIHKKYGLHKKDFTTLINDAEYNEGVLDFFEQLDRDEYIPVLISGGFEELIARAMRELKIFYGYGACEYFFDKNDGYLSGYRIKHCDFEDKYKQLDSIFRRFELRPDSDWIFIGDGKNDIPIAKRAPLSFGINAHKKLAEVVDHSISCFSEIPEILNNTPIHPFVYHSDVDGLLIANKTLNSQIKHLEKKLAKFGTETSIREERLSIEVHNLREQIKRLKQENNKLMGDDHKKRSSDENHVMVKDSDYSLLPERDLKSILDSGYRVVLFGFQESHPTFQAFSGYHKNFRIKSGFNESYNQKELKGYDFIFEFTGNMSHDIDKKNKSIREIVPFSRIRHHNNVEMLENAMANILLRCFNEDKGIL